MSTKNTHFGIKFLSELLNPEKCKKIFFCGIGGISMFSLAAFAMKEGYFVAGSDRSESDLTRSLAEKGAEIYIGQKKENLKNCDAFVYTVAISEDNEEYVKAKELKIPMISRADFLGYIMTKRKNRIGISGTHGKSSTTAMCDSIFTAAKASPTTMCGSKLAKINSPYREGDGEDFIFEACEYMDSFLDFSPTISVILNIEMDHVDYFHSMEQMRKSYENFANIPRESGTVIYNSDDENCILAVENVKGRKISFGICDENADIRAINLKCESGRYSFDVLQKGKFLCHIKLSVLGKHNVYNALASLTAAVCCGISVKDCEKGLCKYAGTNRRMEYKGEINGAVCYDDYAHHPTEISASVKCAKELCREKESRLFCVFQSHTYSRTKALLDEIAKALSPSDFVYIAPIFKARETDDLGMNQYVIAGKVGKNAKGFETLEEISKEIVNKIKKNDVLLVMGAGDINKIYAFLPLK